MDFLEEGSSTKHYLCENVRIAGRSPIEDLKYTTFTKKELDEDREVLLNAGEKE